ncbi:HAD-IA family hydrolase [Arthrospira platensis SPKY1]|nr:HAD-IA family hydrolase [Arthrospira platensis SPKY1]
MPRTKPLRALIFDFDGLILDTETPDYRSWQETYAEFGVELPLDVWRRNIGSTDFFNPYLYLEAQLGRSLDRAAVKAQRKRRDNELLAMQQPLPGVEEYLRAARALGLRIGIASSARRSWVTGHLARLGLSDWFEVVRGQDDVNGRPKPDPAVYLAALEALDVPPAAALALEDSPNGAAAALAAGLTCIVVPNEMTRDLDFPPVARRLTALTDAPLPRLIAELGR